jgi:glycerate kinase
MTVLVMSGKPRKRKEIRVREPRYRASAVVCHRESLLTVRLRDPSSGIVRHFLPGGAVEPGESPCDAAIRECREETGYAIRLQKPGSGPVSYPFDWGGKQVACVTEFFPAFLEDPDAAPHAVTDDPDLNLGAEWVPLEKVSELLGYHQVILKSLTKILSRRPKKFLCAFTGFKGTLSAGRASELAAAVIRDAGHVASARPLADGGRGSLDLWLGVASQSLRPADAPRQIDVLASDPIGREVTMHIGMRQVNGRTELFIESSGCLGLHLVDSPGAASAMIANTAGFGSMLRDISRRFPAGTSCIVGLGDSAVSDCGAGMLMSLGFGLRRRSGEIIEKTQFNAALLREIVEIVPPLRGTEEYEDLQVLRAFKWKILCDVSNPLCGPRGAMRIFAAQKGAEPDQVNTLIAGARQMARLFQRSSAADNWSVMSHGGASGGLAAAIAWVLRTKLHAGAPALLRMAGMKRALRQHDFTLTGEGRSDNQSPGGKAAFVCLKMASEEGIPAILVSGELRISSWPRNIRKSLIGTYASGLDPDAETAFRRAVHRALVETLCRKVL